MYVKKVKTANQRNLVIISEFESGKTLQAVGNIFGLSRQRVHQILLTNGIDTKREPEKASRELIEDLYFRQNLAIAKIAKLLSISVSKLKHQLDEYQIPIEKHRKNLYKRKEIEKGVLEDLYLNQRISFVKICKKLKVSQDVLRRNLDNWGLTREPLKPNKKEKASLIDRDKLHDLYITRCLPRKKVVEILGCTDSLFRYCLKEYKIFKVPNLSISKLKRNEEKRKLKKFSTLNSDYVDRKINS